jgi:translation initiation factor IF-2
MLEALEQSVYDLAETEECDIEIVTSGIGEVCDDDIDSAVEFKAKILTMNVGVRGDLKTRASKEEVSVKVHRLIYHLLDDVLMMTKDTQQAPQSITISGNAVVRKVYEVDLKAKVKPKIAGLEVTSGTLRTRCLYKIIRNQVEVARDLQLEALKRFKVNVKEVTKGQECGLSLVGFSSYEVDDVVQAYELDRGA